MSSSRAQGFRVWGFRLYGSGFGMLGSWHPNPFVSFGGSWDGPRLEKYLYIVGSYTTCCNKKTHPNKP